MSIAARSRASSVSKRPGRPERHVAHDALRTPRRRSARSPATPRSSFAISTIDSFVLSVCTGATTKNGRWPRAFGSDAAGAVAPVLVERRLRFRREVDDAAEVAQSPSRSPGPPAGRRGCDSARRRSPTAARPACRSGRPLPPACARPRRLLLRRRLAAAPSRRTPSRARLRAAAIVTSPVTISVPLFGHEPGRDASAAGRRASIDRPSARRPMPVSGLP